MSFQDTYYKNLSLRIKNLLQNSGITEPPVDIRKIVSDCGAKATPFELGEEISGVLVMDNGKGTIGYNSSNSRVRQRFTIAHELGHLLQHVTAPSEVFVDKDFIVKFRSNKPYTNKELRQEREANAFAAAILMPKDFIIREVSKSDYNGLSETQLIEKLAKVFEVSVPAMTYRFSDLNIFQF